MPFKKGVPIPGQKRFVKGVSGNAAGRHKKIPALDKLLAEVLGEEKDGVTAAQVVLMALRKAAINGNVYAAEALLSRAYGKPKENVDIKLRNTVEIITLPDNARRQGKDS